MSNDVKLPKIKFPKPVLKIIGPVQQRKLSMRTFDRIGSLSERIDKKALKDRFRA
jgi:hypothetical protein